MFTVLELYCVHIYSLLNTCRQASLIVVDLYFSFLSKVNIDNKPYLTERFLGSKQIEKFTNKQTNKSTTIKMCPLICSLTIHGLVSRVSQQHCVGFNVILCFSVTTYICCCTNSTDDSNEAQHMQELSRISRT